MVSAFLCSPSRKESLGLANTETRYYTLSSSEATTLRNFYEASEAGKAEFLQLVFDVLGTAIQSTVASMAYSMATSIAVSLIQEHMETLDNDFDEVLSNQEEYIDVKCVYQYRRHGRSGAYFLESVEVA